MRVPFKSEATRVTGEVSVPPSFVINWPCKIREAMVSVLGPSKSLLAINVIFGTNVKGLHFSKLEKEIIVVDSKVKNWEVIVFDKVLSYVLSAADGITVRWKWRVTR